MGPRFNADFRKDLESLLAWRRDVRRFRHDPVPPTLIRHLLSLVQLAPSVGNSQPWRWVSVDDGRRRQSIRDNFLCCNEAARASQADDRQGQYAALKLEGLRTAPVQLAVFCDSSTAQGHGLGRMTMPETMAYSTVAAITTFWLAARAEGLGVGWLSILDPAQVTKTLDVDPGWQFVAYLCVGWPEEEHVDPELVRHDWQARTEAGSTIIQR